MRHPCSLLLWFCLSLVAAAAIGCAAGTAGSASFAAGSGIDSDEEAASFVGEPAPSAGVTGLEVRWWVVDDQGKALFNIAQEHGASLDFLPESRRQHLATHGFRLLRVPMSEFEGLAGALAISGQISSDWLGQAPRWTGVMPGPRLPEGSTVDIAGREVYLPAGRFELALRTWIVPTNTGPFLQLELLPRYEPSRERTLASLAGEVGRRRPIEEALVRLRLESGSVYLLTSESPRVAWQVTPAEPELEETSSAPAESAAEAIGPLTPDLPTVGELLLRPSTTAGMPGVGRRAVAVFLPYLPREASLLPAVR